MPKKRVDDSKEEGVYYVTSQGNWYKAPKIDADLIAKHLENPYLAPALRKEQRMLFREKYSIEILDSEGESDPELAKQINRMCNRPEVRLWNAIQGSWRDIISWGPAIFNPVWGKEVSGKGTERQLIKLRRLRPESFISMGSAYSLIRNRILPGICLDTENNPHFFQTQSTGIIEDLQNILMITDPDSTEYGGTPGIIPIISPLNMLSFSWKAQMQKMNRLGAGGLFTLKLTNPTAADKEYASNALKNVSKDFLPQLRENMEWVNIDINDNATALDTIEVLKRLIADQFSPSSSISKEGTLIGGSANPEYQMYCDYIRGTLNWLEESWEQVLQQYLDKNGYEDYEAHIHIPGWTVDKTEVFIKLAIAGFQTKSASLNEIRVLLGKAGAPIQELDDAGIEKLITEYERLGPGSPVFAKAQLAIEAMKANPLDAYGVIERRKAKKIIQTALSTFGDEASAGEAA